MITDSMNGKKIRAAYGPGDDGLVLNSGGNGIDYHLSATYHGDRDEFWVVGMKDGNEVERHNAKHIASIYWAD